MRARRRTRRVVIGLDLGTKGGYCILVDGIRLFSGTWDHSVKTKRKNNPDMAGHRWVKFANNLHSAIGVMIAKGYDQSDIRVVYENVNRHIGTTAAHVFGGWLAILHIVEVEYPDIEFTPASVSAWKKSMCGSGRATKEEYIESANIRYGLALSMKDEDQAAACGVAFHGDRLK